MVTWSASRAALHPKPGNFFVVARNRLERGSTEIVLGSLLPGDYIVRSSLGGNQESAFVIQHLQHVLAHSKFPES